MKKETNNLIKKWKKTVFTPQKSRFDEQRKKNLIKNAKDTIFMD